MQSIKQILLFFLLVSRVHASAASEDTSPKSVTYFTLEKAPEDKKSFNRLLSEGMEEVAKQTPSQKKSSRDRSKGLAKRSLSPESKQAIEERKKSLTLMVKTNSQRVKSQQNMLALNAQQEDSIDVLLKNGVKSASTLREQRSEESNKKNRQG